MPTSLFLKIFLWFWLAMTLVGGALVLSSELTRDEVPIPRWRGTAVSFYAERSVELLQEGGRDALDDYLQRLERTSRIRASVFDSRGQEVSGQTPPPGAVELVTRARRSGAVELQRAGGSMLAARSGVAPDGKSYTIVAQVPGPLRRLSAEPADLAVRLLAVLLTGGLVCYGLARYLTAPVSQLQKTVREMSVGNLSARVGATLESRGDEFADLGREFDLMAERLEGLIDSQRRLLSDISHELRSPLARLTVALELARKRSGAEARTSLDRIEREAERMNQLIGQLLRLAQLANNADTGEETPRTRVQLATLVREVASDADFEAGSQNRGVTMTETEECVTVGSEGLLRSAIENIVRNALRYTDEETEVEVSLRCQQIQNQDCATIVVKDHGPGVPEEVLDDLFRPFYRMGDARDRQSGGTGLGLAIAERIVRLHGGTVTATNASDGGLQVEILLPLG